MRLDLNNLLQNYGVKFKMSASTLIVFTLSLIFASCSSAADPSSSPDLPTLDPENTPLAATAMIDLSAGAVTPQPLIKETSQPTRDSLPTTPYSHPQDLFRLGYPETWSVIQSDAVETSFNDPSGRASLHIDIIHTGYSYDDASTLRLIEARERNLFSSYDNYVEVESLSNTEDGTFTRIKQLTAEGKSQRVTTDYRQNNNVIFVLDFWAELESWEEFGGIYASILASAEFDFLVAKDLDPLSLITFYRYENGVASFELPTYWEVNQNKSGGTRVDTIYSPDRHAAFQIMLYNDGQPLSKSVAGEFTLNLLREYYTKDIVFITENSVLGGRLERLVWRSASESYQGSTYFETIDSQMIIFSAMFDHDFEDYYHRMLDILVSSYELLIEGEEQ